MNARASERAGCISVSWLICLSNEYFVLRNHFFFISFGVYSEGKHGNGWRENNCEPEGLRTLGEPHRRAYGVSQSLHGSRLGPLHV